MRHADNQNLTPTAKALRDLRDEAARLAHVIDLELSGVCDGDGAWHGSEPMLAITANVEGAMSACRSSLIAEHTDCRPQDMPF